MDLSKKSPEGVGELAKQALRHGDTETFSEAVGEAGRRSGLTPTRKSDKQENK